MDESVNMDIDELSAPIKKLKDKWKLLPEFLKVRGLVKQHIDSFNHFVTVEMKKIVNANSRITTQTDPNFWLEFTDIRLNGPTVETELTSSATIPHECRLRDMTYAGSLVVDVMYTKGKRVYVERDIVIGKMPIMLKSEKCILSKTRENDLARLEECIYDPGGYFIVNGVEKVILIQEQRSKNRIITEMNKAGNVMATVTSTSADRKSKTDIVLKKGQLVLLANSFSEEIPIVIVLKAMGCESDQEIAQLVGIEFLSMLAPSIEKCRNLKINSQIQALDYVGKRVRVNIKNRAYSQTRTNVEDGRSALNDVVLSHVKGSNNFNFQDKVIYIAIMIRRIFQSKEDSSKIDDKDYYGNKRLELSGQLLALLFEDLFKSFCNMVRKSSEASLKRKARAAQFDAMHCIRGVKDIISRGFENAIATGNWTIRRFKMERAGITQALSRLSFIATIGHMTRITSSVEKTRKVSGPRALQTSQWGVICPSDTPEGESCGLVKNLALMTHVTMDEDDTGLRKIAFNLGVQDTGLTPGVDWNQKGTYIVFLNGLILGIVRQRDAFITNFKRLRRGGHIQEFVSVYSNEAHQSIYISSDGGRVCRPLIIVENGQSLVIQKHLNELNDGSRAFDDFVTDGLIEYLDVNEENGTLIALREEDISKDSTHLEIDPMTILGAVAGLIPYPHHNQSPRNTYQCAMGKQAMGAIGYNQLRRIDTLLYNLVFPQKPLVKTRTIEAIGFENLPAGQNVTLAVMSFSGYDIEDAIVLNKASLDRGFGRCLVYKKAATTMKRYGNNARDRILSNTNTQEWIEAAFDPLRFNQTLLCASDRAAARRSYCDQIVEKLASIYGVQPESPVENARVPWVEERELVNEYRRIKLEWDQGNTKVPFSTFRDLIVGMKQRDCTYPNIKSILTEYNNIKAASERNARSMALDLNGIARPGAIAHSNYTLISKQKPANVTDDLDKMTDDERNRYTNMYLSFRGRNHAFVDRVLLTSNEHDNFILKVLMRETRRPEVGDKFSSRHGQKGVVGLVVNQEDLPFSEFGICPDIIMNPHGFPSRMTVGKMIELIAGKAGVLEGEFRYGTAFGGDPVEECCATLVKSGFNYHGKDMLTSGITGEPLQVYVFMGPVYYQKLRHMVMDKMHARAKGPRAVLTRQPTQGKSREGGLRLGEMERDCLIGYGAAMLLQERLCISSDQHTAHVCRICGLIGYKDWCQYCKRGDRLAKIHMPYAAKLLFQELMSMNISPRLRLEEPYEKMQ